MAEEEAVADFAVEEVSEEDIVEEEELTVGDIVVGAEVAITLTTKRRQQDTQSFSREREMER